MKRWIIVMLLLIASGLGYIAYHFYLRPVDDLRAIYLVPKDAVYIFETQEPIKAWNTISKSETWKHLQQQPYFANLTADASYLTETIDNNATLFKFLGSRQIMISAHMYKANDYDFLYIVDLQKAGKIVGIKDYLKNIGKGFKTSIRRYKEVEIMELFNTADKSTLSMAFIQNKLVMSYRAKIVENSIDQYLEPSIGRDLNYQEVFTKVDGDGLFRIYIQYAFLDNFMKCYMADSNPYINLISSSLFYSGMSYKQNDDLLQLNGFTNVNDSVPSQLLAMKSSGKGHFTAMAIAPQRTAFYLGLGFGDFSDYIKAYEKLLDPIKDKAYFESKIKLEKFLRISIEKDFASWVDDEAALIQLQPRGMGKNNEFAFVLKAKDVELANEKLDFLMRQIKRKTGAVKFETVDYKGYPINFLSIKGFFRLLFGKLVGNLDRPYYTTIGKYVVFSNHPTVLKNIIDDYVSGTTLDKAKNFEYFIDNFSSTGNMFLYVQTPVLYKNLQTFANAKTWNSIQKNKDFINCFTQIGFQLEENGNMFESRLVLQYTDINTVNEAYKNLAAQMPTDSSILRALNLLPDKEEILNIDDIRPDDLNAEEYEEKYENGKIKLEFGTKNGIKQGSFREYYENGELKTKGFFKNDKRHDTWKFFDENGKLIEKKRYRDGEEI